MHVSKVFKGGSRRGSKRGSRVFRGVLEGV